MTANGERYCSQHHQPRSQCRPGDRHVQTLRARDDLMAAVAARVEAVGLPTMNDGLEMALEAWVRAPLQKVAKQALADRRIRPGRAASPAQPASPGAVPSRSPAVKP
jgi:hypothetical protein